MLIIDKERNIINSEKVFIFYNQRSPIHPHPCQLIAQGERIHHEIYEGTEDECTLLKGMILGALISDKRILDLRNFNEGTPAADSEKGD